MRYTKFPTWIGARIRQVLVAAGRPMTAVEIADAVHAINSRANMDTVRHKIYKMVRAGDMHSPSFKFYALTERQALVRFSGERVGL